MDGQLLRRRRRRPHTRWAGPAARVWPGLDAPPQTGSRLCLPDGAVACRARQARTEAVRSLGDARNVGARRARGHLTPGTFDARDIGRRELGRGEPWTRKAWRAGRAPWKRRRQLDAEAPCRQRLAARDWPPEIGRQELAVSDLPSARNASAARRPPRRRTAPGSPRMRPMLQTWIRTPVLPALCAAPSG